jgi:hypothetical protein
MDTEVRDETQPEAHRVRWHSVRRLTALWVREQRDTDRGRRGGRAVDGG